MIDKISGVYGASAINKVTARKGRNETSSSTASDGIEFSGFAKELAKASQEIRKLPDVREELVEDFRRRIQSETYSPDPEKVARSLIVAGILDQEE